VALTYVEIKDYFDSSGTKAKADFAGRTPQQFKAN
jgi:hypothetical protein